MEHRRWIDIAPECILADSIRDFAHIWIVRPGDIQVLRSNTLASDSPSPADANSDNELQVMRVVPLEHADGSVLFELPVDADLAAPSLLLFDGDVSAKLCSEIVNRQDFDGVVLVSTSRSQVSSSDLVDVQRTLFDRGYVRLSTKARCEHYFVKSALLSDSEHLFNSGRGCVSISELGRKGRFANQLFQFAYVRLYGLRHSLTVETPRWEAERLFPNINCETSSLPMPRLSFGPFDDDDLGLWEMRSPPIDIDLDGYFQELPACLAQHRSTLRHFFRFNETEINSARRWYKETTRDGKRRLIGLHVRRGDYLSHSDSNFPWFRTVPIEWYRELLNEMMCIHDDIAVFVATDDPKCVLPEFEGYELVAPMQSTTGLSEDIRDFICLQYVDELAIANSSFSRMAAILANDKQHCYCPNFSDERFERYQPWPGSSFWERFEDDVGRDSRMGSGLQARRLRSIDSRYELGKRKLRNQRLSLRGLRGRASRLLSKLSNAVSR
jgi:hypothetical protein